MQILKINKENEYFKLQTQLFELKKLLPESDDDWDEVTAKAGKIAEPYDEQSIEFKEVMLALDYVERNYKNAKND